MHIKCENKMDIFLQWNDIVSIHKFTFLTILGLDIFWKVLSEGHLLEITLRML